GIDVHDHDALLLHVGKLAPEAGAMLTVERDGRVMPIAIRELSKFFVPGRKIVTSEPPAWRGLAVDYVTASEHFREWTLQRRLDPQGSVWIKAVQPDSPAWREGLRPDMLITHVGSQRVTTPAEFRQAVANQEGPIKLRLALPAAQKPVRTIEPETS
ncbi:MAG TPA: PDZ domain-containing protein, partial [Pirellulales bacterium]|nr:PDZ domain-containing protein [Pirellulales bacterium]